MKNLFFLIFWRLTWPQNSIFFGWIEKNQGSTDKYSLIFCIQVHKYPKILFLKKIGLRRGYLGPEYRSEATKTCENTWKSHVWPTLTSCKSQNTDDRHEMKTPRDSPGSPLHPQKFSSKLENLDFWPLPSPPQKHVFFVPGVPKVMKGPNLGDLFFFT